jgi:uncharacterized protein
MKARAEAVFALPILGSWLVHAPLSGVSALVNRAALLELWGRMRGSRGASREVECLVEALERPDAESRKLDGDFAPGFLGIIPTRACDLDCVYCDFGSASAGEGKVMELGVAASAVDWMAANVSGRGGPLLDVHFFGGEPFRAPDVVDTAVHRGRAVASSLGIAARFEASTNGCFDDDRLAFVEDYFDAVVISWDGPSRLHDRHRPRKNGSGTAELVERNARALAGSRTEVCIRSCVTAEGLSSLEEAVGWCCSEVTPSAMDLETLKPTARTMEAGIRPPDPLGFASAFARCETIAAAAGVRLVFAAAELEGPRASFCPVATDTAIVDPSGRISSCYLNEADWAAAGLDLSYGRIEEGEVRIDRSAARRIRSLGERRGPCLSCFLRWSCAGGCHVENAALGSGGRLPASCAQARLIAAERLLKALGNRDLADSLFADLGAMEELAYRPSDTLASAASE